MNKQHPFLPAPADCIEVYRQFNGLSAEAASDIYKIVYNPALETPAPKRPARASRGPAGGA